MSSTPNVLQDPDFMAAPLAEKFQYLSHVDQDFAKASPSDQQAYVQHILGGPAPTPAPAQQQGQGFWANAIGGAKNVLRSLPWMAAGDPAAVAGQAISSAGQMASDDVSRQLEGRSGLHRAAAPLAQMLVPGLNPAAMKQATSQGDTAGVLGQAAVPAALAASPLAAEGVYRGTGAVREGIGGSMYTPEGTLRPGAKILGQAAGGGIGATIGHATGVPEGTLAGAYLGRGAGPWFLQKLFPEPGDAVAARETAAEAEATNETYEQRAQDVMRRGREQAAIDRQVAKQAGTQTPAIVSATDPVYSGSEGRAATWTNEDVMRLAAQGNRDAIAQATRRGLQLPPNARYVMGDQDYPRAVYNPRETTTFEPEGTPIRNKANPRAGQPAPGKRIVLPWMTVNQ
jgi:hypothetical protein